MTRRYTLKTIVRWTPIGEPRRCKPHTIETRCNSRESIQVPYDYCVACGAWWEQSA